MISFANIPRNNGALVAFGLKETGPYYWVGNCKNGIDYYAGQTFQAPATGQLKRIKLFSSIVYGQPYATLTVYEFDNTTHTFKQKQSETGRQINKAHESQWLDFDLSNLQVNKDAYYAFKLQCKGTGMLAIAECPWNVQNPYAEGEQWTGSSLAEAGSFHYDFDLAFEGEIEASSNAKFI